MPRLLTLSVIPFIISLIVVLPSAAQIPTDGLVAYYPFNGNANDESGNGNNGECYGATLTNDRFGNAHSAYDFDGVDDLIVVQSSASMEAVDSAFTLATWVYVNDWDNTWVGIVAKSNAATRGQYGIAFQLGGRVDVDIAGTYLPFYTNFQFGLDRWYFLSSTWDGETATVYANGNIIGVLPYSPPPIANQMPFEIGRHTPTNTEYMNGLLDDIRIFDRALSPDEVDALYRENGWPPSSGNLLAFYPFNGNADDFSGNSNHGTLLGEATANTHLAIHENDVDALSIPYTVLDGLGEFTFTAVVQIDNVHVAGGHLVAANSWITGAASIHPGGNGFNIVYDGTIQHWRILIVPPFQTNYFFDFDARMEDHQPHHIAVSRVRNEARLYLDGFMVGNPTIVPDVALECDEGGFIVGQDQDFVGGGFDANQCLAGEVDNLRIFSRALTSEEVLGLCLEDGILATDVEGPDQEGTVPEAIALRQNYPNPFNPTTTIEYELPTEQHIRLSVFNVLGQMVATLVDDNVAAGRYSVTFDGRSVGSGTYFYRMETGNFTETRKLVILK